MAVFCCLVVRLLLEKINEGKAYLNCVQHYLSAVCVETEQLSWVWQNAICHQMGHILEPRGGEDLSPGDLRRLYVHRGMVVGQQVLA